jgi:hypothetical protein
MPQPSAGDARGTHIGHIVLRWSGFDRLSGDRQRIVSAWREGSLMPADIDTLLRRMIGGDPVAAEEIVDRAATSDCPRLLVAASVISTEAIRTAAARTAATSTAATSTAATSNTAVVDPAAHIATPQQLLARAGTSAVTTRDRQLVAVAAAHIGGADDLLDVLVREHLSDFPDNILAAWIATRRTYARPPTLARPPISRSSNA